MIRETVCFTQRYGVGTVNGQILYMRAVIRRAFGHIRNVDAESTSEGVNPALTTTGFVRLRGPESGRFPRG